MTSSIRTDVFLDAYLLLLDEFAGEPPKAEPGNACLDSDAGWKQTLEVVDATRASRPAVPGGTTIAAHTAHAAYYVELLQRFAAGEEPTPDWPGSFQPSDVDERSWDEQRERLLAALRRFRAMVAANTDWSEERTQGALSIVAHTAYHLGAVRQLLRVVAGER
jgi:hypothetical protein